MEIKERGFADDFEINENKNEVKMRTYTTKIVEIIEDDSNIINDTAVLNELLAYLSEDELKRFFLDSPLFDDFNNKEEDEED